MNLQDLGLNDQIVYALFGGEGNHIAWFKSALREELERRQLAAARETVKQTFKAQKLANHKNYCGI